MQASKLIWLIGAGVLPLTLITTEAHAAVQILAESGDSIELLDLNSVKKTGTQRRVMLTTIYAVAKALPTSNGITYQSASASAIVDCKKSQYALQKMDLFDPAGKLLGSKQFPSMAWKALKPGFPIASAAAAVCGHRDKKAQIRNSIEAARTEYLERLAHPPAPSEPAPVPKAKRRQPGSGNALSPKTTR
jgi:hypothetical protein